MRERETAETRQTRLLLLFFFFIFVLLLLYANIFSSCAIFIKRKSVQRQQQLKHWLLLWQADGERRGDGGQWGRGNDAGKHSTLGPAQRSSSCEFFLGIFHWQRNSNSSSSRNNSNKAGKNLNWNCNLVIACRICFRFLTKSFPSVS